MAIDFNFLREVEGFETDGYVPQDDQGVIENSGVTVGSGIDLGQWKRQDLEKMGVPKSILNKLDPYFGKKKDKAVEALSQQPLQLTTEEAESLTTAVKKGYSNNVKRWYNRNNTAGNDWSDLTDRQQTAITSVAFQYGVGSKNTPKFNKQVLSNNWEGLVKELRNFGDRYDTRRAKELQYLVGATPDGVIGPQTEAAVSRFLTGQQETVADMPQPVERSQIDPAGFLQGLMQLMEERRNAQQSPSQEGSEAVMQADTAKDVVNPLVQELANVLKGKRQSDEEGLERTYNEARLEAEARKEGYTPTGSDALVQALSKSEVIKSVKFDRPLPPKQESRATEELAGGQDDSRDPIYGIF